MDRITSSSSSVSTKSAQNVPSVWEVYSPDIEENQLYWYSLKLLIFEYINEPRFRSSSNVSHGGRQSFDTKHTSLSTIGNSTISGNDSNITSGKDDKVVLKSLKDRLEVYLRNVTIGEIKMSNQDYRRSLMKYYNDYFLNPALRSNMIECKRPEDMIVYFSKTANSQLNKFNNGHIQNELYAEISLFISLMISLVSDSASETFIKRLRDYEHILKSDNTVQHNKRSSSLGIPSVELDNYSSSSHKSTVNSPTFRIEQITHATYFSELFGIDPLILQQDVIKVSQKVTNECFCKELRTLYNQINKNDGPLTSSDFPSDRDYHNWKTYMIEEMDVLFERFEKRTVHSGASSQTYEILPENPRDLFVALMSKVFLKECKSGLNSLNLSQDAMFFLTRFSKYWMVDYYSTLSALLYTAMNISVLKDEEINIPLTENLFTMLDLKVLKAGAHKDSSSWNDKDQKQWIINIFSASNQCICSLDNLLTALFAPTRPKFTPILSFYYNYVESDPAFVMFKKYTQYNNNSDIKKLKRTIFKTAEERYITLLNSIPKDKTIELHHIQDLGEQILNDVKEIQKRYSKPLLNRINIAFTVAEMLIAAYATDFLPMLKRASKYYKQKHNVPIPPVNALELYTLVKELEGVYMQVNPKNPLPWKPEEVFYKYLARFVREIIKNIKNVIINSLKNEQWNRVNLETLFSQSVLDIFKMINESINLVRQIEWESETQIAKVFTLILKEFSDDLKMYSQDTLKLIQSDLRQSSLEAIRKASESQSLQTREMGSVVSAKKRWTFHDMKNALKSSSGKVVPPPFEYRMRTCVMLNDIETMIRLVNELDEKIDPEQISLTISQDHNNDPSADKELNLDQPVKQIYSVRIIEAKDIRGYGSDGRSNVSVSLRCSTKQRESGSTQIVPKTNNPVWDEEFEIDLPYNGQTSLTFNVWHHATGKLRSFSGDDLCGRATLSLNPKNFTDDGFPNSRTLDLDTQGQLFVEISLETDRCDALAVFGRIYRVLTRSRDRAVELLVIKFSSYVSYSFSKETLKDLAKQSNGSTISDDSIYDAIVPLFDYLNANLTILASQLTPELLFMVMLKAWFVILKAADNLVLPQLSIAKNRLENTKNSLWKPHSSSLAGYGHALTIKEIEIVFKWLDALCVDFFYNNGEGPPLDDLKNKDYQTLLLVPVFYDRSSLELKAEVKRLTPSYYKFTEHKYRDNNPNMVVSRKLTSIERRKTIMKNSFKKTREQLDREALADSSDQLERDSELLDVILRILIAKGETDFVYQHLHQRKLKRKMIAITSIADKAANGQKVKYKK